MSPSSPLSPESFQLWIHLHTFPNNIFDLPPIPHNDKQRLWLTCPIGHGSTGSVWKCHFDKFEKPFAVKVVEITCPSNIEAQKRFHKETFTLLWKKHINPASCRIVSLRVATVHSKENMPMLLSLIVTRWGVLDIFDKLDEDFDLFPKSLPQQNQIKSMVIAKAKRKGKKVCPS